MWEQTTTTNPKKYTPSQTIKPPLQHLPTPTPNTPKQTTNPTPKQAIENISIRYRINVLFYSLNCTLSDLPVSFLFHFLNCLLVRHLYRSLFQSLKQSLKQTLKQTINTSQFNCIVARQVAELENCSTVQHIYTSA